MSGGGGHGGGRRKRHEEHEEHENHERWLVSYADLVTVLMALFIVMFAISNVDTSKMKALAASLQQSFGNPIVTIDGGPAGPESEAAAADPFEAQRLAAPQTDPRVQAAVAFKDRVEEERRARAAEAEVKTLDGTKQRIQKALAKDGLQDQVRFRYDERGLVVTLVTDEVLFASGRAELQEGGRKVVHAIGPVLRDLPNSILVEGHTNALPTGGQPYATNWELSLARSASVLRRLIDEEGVPGRRLSAAGYGEQRPLVPGVGERALKVNRRVEVIVMSTLPPQDAALLPEVAAAAEPAPAAPAQAAPAAPAAPAPTESHASAH